MRYIGFLTRLATMLLGFQLITAACLGFAVNGVQPGPVVGLLVGFALLVLPLLEQGMRRGRSATVAPSSAAAGQPPSS